MKPAHMLKGTMPGSSLCLLILLAFSVARIQAQQSGLTVEKSPNPELVGQLSKQLSVTPAQATGGAGTLFNLAKGRLSSADFGQIAAVVPGMNGLLRAAPAASSPGGGSPLSGLSSSLPGSAGGLASAATSFQKLGLSPDMATKFVPVLTQFVQSKGGSRVASLLSGVLK
ncbi:MAG TPA: DUF2780 domain-containing protein [Candidatus Angelobacter sp.]|nr:DUF2780 domain-containing protein [Candidatus Angelobacter sp.]